MTVLIILIGSVVLIGMAFGLGLMSGVRRLSVVQRRVLSGMAIAAALIAVLAALVTYPDGLSKVTRRAPSSKVDYVFTRTGDLDAIRLADGAVRRVLTTVLGTEGPGVIVGDLYVVVSGPSMLGSSTVPTHQTLRVYRLSDGHQAWAALDEALSDVTISDGVVYLNGAQANATALTAYAFSLIDGRELWHHDLSQPNTFAAETPYISQTANQGAVAGIDYVVGFDHIVTALSAHDGAVLWHQAGAGVLFAGNDAFFLENDVTYPLHGAADPTGTGLSGQLLGVSATAFYLATREMVTAYQRSDDTLIWQVQVPRTGSSRYAASNLNGGMLTADGLVYAVNDNGCGVTALAASNGKLVWQSPSISPCSTGNIEIGGGNVYLATYYSSGGFF